MSSPAFQRAQLLLQQNRAEGAEPEIRRHLAEQPQDPFGHALLSQILNQLERHPPAIEAAREAVSLAPDLAWVHYVHAQALLSHNQPKPAAAAIAEAHRLDPEDADVLGLRAWICLTREQWEEGLRWAQAALALDPEHTQSLNARAHALQMLNRNEEAAQSLQETLAAAPENSFAHANQGWHQLRQGHEQPAIGHFKEALRLDPENEYARSGILEALKARNPIYKPILAYFVWMSRLSEGARWGVILGLYLIYRFGGDLLTSSPERLPWAIALMALYLLFVLTSWAGPTIFNLTLWFHPLGRHALNDREKTASLLCFIALLGGVGALGTWTIDPSDLGRLAWAALFPFLCIPIATAYTLESPPRKRLGFGLLLLLSALVLSGFTLDLLGHPLSGALRVFSILGLALYTWLGNFLARE
ncbi:MAG: tetratricopeptide repeat protein [Verrucomicrobiota bacterium]